MDAPEVDWNQSERDKCGASQMQDSPYYPCQTPWRQGADFRTREASMQDIPGHTWSMVRFGQFFETCAICVQRSGSAPEELSLSVLNCVKWGHEVAPGFPRNTAWYRYAGHQRRGAYPPQSATHSGEAPPSATFLTTVRQNGIDHDFFEGR